MVASVPSVWNTSRVAEQFSATQQILVGKIQDLYHATAKQALSTHKLSPQDEIKEQPTQSKFHDMADLEDIFTSVGSSCEANANATKTATLTVAGHTSKANNKAKLKGAELGTTRPQGTEHATPWAQTTRPMSKNFCKTSDIPPWHCCTQ